MVGERHELIVAGGLVVDGTGAPGFRADVAVRDGVITAVAPSLDGERRIDATGLVVAPGFIDVHTHYDAQVFWDPALTPSCWHGVTTVIAGNCGFSLAPCREADRDLLARTLQHVEDMPIESLRAGVPWDFETYGDYLAAVERRGTVLNFGGYVGHTAVRMYVMGGDDAYDRAATPEEITAMRDTVAAALRSGAIGFSTSSAPSHQGDRGRPVPSRQADRAEVAALLGALRDEGRGIAEFLPGEKLVHADVYELQPEIGRPFTWIALVTMPGGYHENLLEVHARGAATGAEVWPQMSARPVSIQMTLAEPFTFRLAAPFLELMTVSHDEVLRRFRDPAWRRVAFDALNAVPLGAPRWAKISVAESDTRPDLAGRTLAELAVERDCTPLDVALDLALAEGLRTRFTVIVANDDIAAISAMLPRDDLILGLGDGGAHVGQICDAAFPTELLGVWVRERNVLSVEAAVRKLTGQAADAFRIERRGYVREGFAADLTVFDPATVAPGPLRRVRDFPGDAERLVADRPEGVVHVLVNGVPIRLDGRPLDDALVGRPGRIIRSTPRDATTWAHGSS